MEHTYKKLVSLSLFICSIFTATFATTMVFAKPTIGSSEVTFSSAGGTDKDFDSIMINLDGSYSYYVMPMAAAGLRQSVSFTESQVEGRLWDGSSRIFYDYHFGDKVRSFVGANLGYIYGDSVRESFMAGPELGLKYYALSNAFVNAIIEYQIIFENAKDYDGAFVYSLGIGFNF